jgi:hypothetical protein
MMVAEKTGWSKEQILNDVSFSELNLMLADSPRLIRKTNNKKLTTDEEYASFFKTSLD